MPKSKNSRNHALIDFSKWLQRKTEHYTLNASLTDLQAIPNTNSCRNMQHLARRGMTDA